MWTRSAPAAATTGSTAFSPASKYARRSAMPPPRRAGLSRSSHFTNEEGSRFAPYAMGSLVYVGGLSLEDAYAVRGIDGKTVGEELRRIGYAGSAKPGWLKPHAYLELHIEQGRSSRRKARSSARWKALP